MRANIGSRVPQFIHGGGQRRGNRILPEWQSGRRALYPRRGDIFKLDGAVAQLNADYWQPMR